MDPCLLPFNTSACDEDEREAHEPGRRGVTLPLAVSVFIHLLVICVLLLVGRIGFSSRSLGEAVIRVALVSLPNPEKKVAKENTASLTEKSPVEIPAPNLKRADILPEKKRTPAFVAKASSVRKGERRDVETVPTAVDPASDRRRQQASDFVPISGSAPENEISQAELSMSHGGEGEGVAPKTGDENLSTGAAIEHETVIGQQYLDENFLYIKERIAQNLSYPPAARRMKQQGVVTVSFSILESGMVENITIVNGSGYKLLDDHAVGVIRDLQPFPKPPVRAEITLPVKYSLHR